MSNYQKGGSTDKRTLGLKIGDKVTIKPLEETSVITKASYTFEAPECGLSADSYPKPDEEFIVENVDKYDHQDIQLSNGIWYVGVEDLIKVEA